MSTNADVLAAQGLDIEKLLAPVSEANPVGDDLSRLTIAGKSMAMAEIEERRKAIIAGTNENLEAGEQVDPAALARQRRSEWREIERLLIVLFAKGKELGAAVSLAQAAVASHGWVALGPCLRFIRQLQERFGDALYPVAETDDQGNPDFIDRLVLMERLDHENFLPLALRQLPMTDPRSGGEFSWADVRGLEILKSAPPSRTEDADARRQMIEERSSAIDSAVSKSGRQHFEMVVKAIQEGSAELDALREFVDQKYAGAPQEDRPTFRQASEAIEVCQALAMRYLRQKGGGQPAPEEASGGLGTSGAAADSGGGSGVVVSGADVVPLLERALALLKAHQKHNPAAFLVEEAIRWAKMPISRWYLEALEDPNMSGFIAKLMRAGGGPENSPEG